MTGSGAWAVILRSRTQYHKSYVAFRSETSRMNTCASVYAWPMCLHRRTIPAAPVRTTGQGLWQG